MTPASTQLRFALALAQSLTSTGVRDVVASPGSRSPPLALAFHYLGYGSLAEEIEPRVPDLRIHVVLDERVAGFVGLGIAKIQRRPTVLISTSGSAPAH